MMCGRCSSFDKRTSGKEHANSQMAILATNKLSQLIIAARKVKMGEKNENHMNNINRVRHKNKQKKLVSRCAQNEKQSQMAHYSWVKWIWKCIFIYRLAIDDGSALRTLHFRTENWNGLLGEYGAHKHSRHSIIPYNRKFVNEFTFSHCSTSNRKITFKIKRKQTIFFFTKTDNRRRHCGFKHRLLCLAWLWLWVRINKNQKQANAKLNYD